MVHSQIVSIIHVSLSNYIPFFHYFPSSCTHYLFHIVYSFLHVSLSNCALYPRLPLLIVCFIHVSLSIGLFMLLKCFFSNCTLYQCFPLKLYAFKCFPLKLYTNYPCSPSQIVCFTHASLSNGIFYIFSISNYTLYSCFHLLSMRD